MNRHMFELNWWKAIALGILVWLVPFLASFLFYTPGGDLSIDLVAFKTIMLLVSSVTGAFFIWYFWRDLNEHYVAKGFALGLVWLLTNWVLDMVTLVFLFQEPLLQYFIHTGLRYLSIPITTTLVGVISQRIEKKALSQREVLEHEDTERSR